MKPGYKQTEVGVIPEEWETYLLEEISERISVGLATSVTKHYRGSGVPIVRNLNIKDGFFDGSDMLFVSPEFANANESKAARAFDVLTVHTGSNLGQTCVLPLEFDNCQTFTTLITTPKKRIADSHFLCLHMSSEFGRNEMARLQAGGGKGNLNTGELKKYRIALPRRLTEQRAIATALSDVDELLGGLDRLIAKKRDLKKAAMQQLLTGQTRFPGFHGEWEVKRLGDIVEKIVGGGTPSRANTAFWGNEIPWVTVKDFATFNPQHSQESITRLGLRNSASHLIPAGTLITSTRMALGKAVVYAVDVSINQDLKALFLKPEVSVGYLTYWFEHFGSLIDELGSGSTVKGISLVELRRFPFQAPPLPEQTAIASVLTEMDGELAALERRREKTRALKQAMMQELLTGKTRLI